MPCLVVVFTLLACGAAERLPLPSRYEAHDPAVRGQIASLERRVRLIRAIVRWTVGAGLALGTVTMVIYTRHDDPDVGLLCKE